MHANAAQLFSDYVMSPEGQTLFESMGRTPAKVTSQSNSFRFTLIDPLTVLDESGKWEKVWNDLFVRR
jgi:iron(III) transport system substrate-binding protein